MKPRLAAPALLVIAFSGCAGVDRKTPEIPVEIASKWTAQDDAASTISVLPTTSEAFVEDLALPGLAALIEEGLSHNHDLRAAAARLAAAASDARIAGAARYPEIAASLGGGRRREIYIGLPVPGSDTDILRSESTSLNLGLDIRWEVDLWGRIRKGALAAGADAEAAEWDYRSARLSLAAAIARAWAQAVSAKRLLQMSLETHANLTKSVRWTEARYEGGLLGPLDVRLARADLASSEADLKTRSQLVAASRRQLEKLLGRYPAARIDTSDELPPLPRAIPAGLPVQLLARRPDVRAARERAVAASARFAAATADRWPRLSLTGRGGTTSIELADLLRGDFLVWNLAANLTQPIFDGKRLASLADRARAEEERFIAEYAQTVLDALAEVETALDTAKWLSEREDALRRLLADSEAAETLTRRRYYAGTGDVLTMLASERRAATARSRFTEHQLAAWENRIDLHLALAGDLGSGEHSPGTADSHALEAGPR